MVSTLRPCYRTGSLPSILYFAILITHVTLAAILPLALVTFYRAWRERFDRHRRIAG
jgi:uncharacterized membrane protein YozB (DUF420 family)